MTSITNTATRKHTKRTGRIGVMPSKWFASMQRMADDREKNDGAPRKTFAVRCTVPNMTPVRSFVMPLDFSL